MLLGLCFFGVRSCLAQRLQQPGQFERVLLESTNQERTARGLGPLAWDPALAGAASLHVLAMIQANMLSHQLPGEPDVAHRAAKQGAHFSAVAENIAYGSDPATIEQQWMQSPPHRANILDPRMNLMGVGLLASGGTLWAVEDFAAGSPVLAPGAVEQMVEGELRVRGIRIAAGDGEEKTAARVACPQEEGGVGADARVRSGFRPRFIVRWESSDLRRLPIV